MTTFLAYSCAEGALLFGLTQRTGEKSQGLEFRSLSNRGLARKKVKLGSASNSTFFLRDSHDCMAGYSTMAFSPVTILRTRNALKAQYQPAQGNTLGYRALRTNAL